MTQRDMLQKWLAYGLALILTAGLQELVFGRLRPLGVTPVLLPPAVAALAALEGAAPGAGFGIAVGVMSMYLDGEGAWIIAAACVGGALTGLTAQHVLSRSFIGYLLCTLALLGVRMGWLALPLWYAGAAPLPVLLRLGGAELLWTMLLSPLVYLMFRFVYRRWGSGYYL